MIGTLWTGISGLSSHQKALDNESNNIANVNTIGYKSSRISFADMMYQDKIGKGSKVLDAEKLYTQGNLKLTGMNYDMALSGDGFFTVANKSSSGTSESYYTRAGNFRMGNNGTLQDSAGNEVQGWMMSSIDIDNDVMTTNPNVNVFTNDYSKLLGSEIIRHSTYVETITAKATDYLVTAQSDSTSIFSGDGAKTKSSKISDVELATSDYSNWLQKLKDEPDGISSPSTAQISQINFKSGSESIIGKNGDYIYVYIDGNKYSQNFILTTATSELKADLLAYDPVTYPDLEGLSGTALETAKTVYDKAAGKIATYKALADKISQIPGLVATMVKEVGTTADVLELDDSFSASTKNVDMLNGIMQIKSLIPGEQFTVSEVAETSGITTVQGNTQTTSVGVKGSGIGAVETSRDALANLISGKQQDVYTTSDLNLSKSPMYQYNLSIYDKELGYTLPVPNNGATPPVSVSLFIDATDANGDFTIDELVNKFNQAGSSSTPALSRYVVARNVNNNLVIETLDSNYDVEFNGNIKQLPSMQINLNEIIDNADYTFNIQNGVDLVNLSLTDATYTPFIASNLIDTALSQSQVYNTLKDKITTYNNTNPIDKLYISPLNNGSFSIYTENENVDFDGSTVGIVDDIPDVNSINGVSGIVTTLDNTKISVPFQVDMNAILSSEIFGSEVTWIQNPDGTYESNGVVNLDNTPLSKKLIELNQNYIKDIEFTFDGFGALNTENFTLKDGNTIIGEITGTGYTGTENVTTPLNTSYVDSWDYSNLESTSQGEGTVKLNGITQAISVFATGDALDLNKMVVTLQGTIPSSAPQTPSVPPPYRFTIKDTTDSTVLADINYTTTSTDPATFYAGLLNEIKNTPAYQNGLITATSDATGVNILNHNLIFSSVDNSLDFDTTQGLDGIAKEVKYTIDTGDGSNKSKSLFKLTINNEELVYKTDDTPTSEDVRNYFTSIIQSNPTLNNLVEISGTGDEFIIKNKDTLASGYQNFTASFQNYSLTQANDGYETMNTAISPLTTIDVNENYSGRKGAGAEFLEIINKVDQTASQGSLQLRLDLLRITDSTFGEFSVDSTGLITMKQDGVKFAIGQAAIAMFNNNRGLNAIGDNLLAKTNESGDPIYNINNDKTAKIEAKTLELSTANLSESLVNLMIFQRAFEANAKSITTADGLLNTLLNLKR